MLAAQRLPNSHLSSSFRQISAYQHVMREVQFIMSATPSEVSAMDGLVRRMAKTTMYSCSRVAEELRMLAMEGKSAQECIEALPDRLGA